MLYEKTYPFTLRAGARGARAAVHDLWTQTYTLLQMAQRDLDVKPARKLTESATSDSEGSQYSEESYSSSEDDDEEPVLKYKRFAKEVVQATCEGARDEAEGSRDVINCIAVHPKVFQISMYNMAQLFL